MTLLIYSSSEQREVLTDNISHRHPCLSGGAVSHIQIQKYKLAIETLSWLVVRKSRCLPTNCWVGSLYTHQASSRDIFTGMFQPASQPRVKLTCEIYCSVFARINSDSFALNSHLYALLQIQSKTASFRCKKTTLDKNIPIYFISLKKLRRRNYFVMGRTCMCMYWC